MNKKSVWALVAGALFVIVGTTIIDIALHLVGYYPPIGLPMDDRQSLVATAYRVVISIAGAWITARLAPAKPMKHVMILGVLGTIIGIVGVVATWNRGLGPHWYPVALAVLAIPQSWVGGRLYQARSGNR
jgi:MFS family permease